MTHSLFVIPCAAKKLPYATVARELYDSDNFRHTLRAACAEAVATEQKLDTPTRVVILSALHGLVEIDTWLEPYDVTITSPDRIAATEVAAQLLRENVTVVFAMLPKAYARLLETAVDRCTRDGHPIDWRDVYAGTSGIGEQRAIASAMLRNSPPPPFEEAS